MKATLIALGLLETHKQRSGENSDIKVTLSTRSPSCAEAPT